jgi:hypothetical protein
MMHWKQWYEAETPEQREQRIDSVRANWSRLEPFTQGYYVNLNEESEAKTFANYGDNYPRLVSVKDRFDPNNLMRLNANIQPSI